MAMPSASTDAPSGLLSRTTSTVAGAAGLTAAAGAGAGATGTGAAGLGTAATGAGAFGAGSEEGPRRSTPKTAAATTPIAIALMLSARRCPPRGGTVPAVTLAAAERVVAELEYRRGCAAGDGVSPGR